jgi:hypothetical protein
MSNPNAIKFEEFLKATFLLGCRPIFDSFECAFSPVLAQLFEYFLKIFRNSTLFPPGMGKTGLPPLEMARFEVSELAMP